jgi:hypothetical protein
MPFAHPPKNLVVVVNILFSCGAVSSTAALLFHPVITHCAHGSALRVHRLPHIGRFTTADALSILASAALVGVWFANRYHSVLFCFFREKKRGEGASKNRSPVAFTRGARRSWELTDH